MITKRILIVEDDLIIAESHKEKLSDFGFTNCEICLTKNEALDQLALKTFDLVLLDVRLESKFEGIELGNVISANYAIPFIYLTAHSDLESVKKMVESKPISYLSKPIRKSELYAAVSIVFASNQSIDKSDFVSLQDGGSVVRFKKQQLIFAQSSGNYINLSFSNNSKSKLIRMSLETLLVELNDSNFKRVSRFYVVNVNAIDELHRKFILVNGVKIAYSRVTYDELSSVIS